jgi:putative transcriptional regulator
MRVEKKLFAELLESAQQAVEISQGKRLASRVTRIDPVDVLAVREKLKLSRVEFSNILGVSPRTLESWEQGKRRPSGAANALLRVAAKNPRAVLEALR